MSASWVVLASAAYLGLLFAIAFTVDRGASLFPSHTFPERWTFSLSLAVYSTSWTFYGNVGQAATSTLGFIPLDLGPILVFVFGQPLLRKLLRVCKNQHITSLADLIAARYSKKRSLAVLTTLIVVIGIIPYISLQLKAVSTTFDLLTAAPLGPPGTPVPPMHTDTALYVALLMAGFVMLFGTRRVDATEQHRGMVTTIAFESLVKLAAMLAVGAFVTYGLFDGFGDVIGDALSHSETARLVDLGAQMQVPEFWSIAVLSAMVIICLPRQFQVLVVENTQTAHLRTAAWLFPLYLVALNVFILPIALAGRLIPALAGVSPDSYVLTVPLASDAPWLALFAFLGGFSAATSMIIVETVALATMVSNALILPSLIRGHRLRDASQPSLVGMVKWVRRVSILGILLLAYTYVRLVGNSFALTGIGLVSFVAVALFAPVIVGGLYWRRAHWRGAFWALVAGFGVWCYTLLIPSLAESGWLGRSLLEHGPFGIAALKPYALFGLDGLDRITHGLIWSLGISLGIYVGVSLFSSPTEDDRAVAGAFVDSIQTATEREFSASLHWGDLAQVLARFLGNNVARREMERLAAARGIPLELERAVDTELVGDVERLIAGAVGSSLARVVIASVTRERQDSIAGVLTLLSEASEQIEMQWERLREAVQNIDQGLAMFDAELRLVVWNDRFFEMFGIDPALATVGTPFATLVRETTRDATEADTDSLVRKALERAKLSEPQTFEHQRPNGRVIDVYQKRLPDGGLLATFTDITDRKLAEKALREAKANLEQQVEARTAEVRESEHRFRDFAESASDWFWECDDRLQLTYLSERAAETLGHPAIAAVGQGLTSLAATHEVSPETWKKHLDDLDARRPFSGIEYPIETGDREPTHVRLSGKPVFDAGGVFLGYRGTATDVTELVRAQLELIRQEKMAALGGLVAGVAHEINTPVGIGITATSFLRERASEFSERYAKGQMKRSDLEAFLSTLDESLASLENNLHRAAGLVRSFKQVAVDQSSDAPRRFNVKEYLGEILDSLRPRLKRTPHTVSVECPDDLEIQSFPGAWSQILTNLIINSLQHGFTDDVAGHIEIVVREDAGTLWLTYRDDGRGMSADLARLIFDPFFTTRRSEGGSGLGMHIVYNLVTQQLQGRITCITAPGKGISFTITLPLTTEPPNG
ncbi:PAS-domain containing protein [Azoarcus sp. KH32C]|uniref:PAS-domain containing protein n=1 Tax=Azoarcus sp. KH32C TaxID=748247 RepID=UPI0002386647|nr:PAS-domain containing protein [Azoarcus sp. KH32C]BAL25263.1 hypothetical protein AZKH_2964 [Azoarcus sp. KH32C]